MNRIRQIIIVIACAAVAAAAQPLQKIVPPGHENPSWFGYAVAMSGNRMIVGAPFGADLVGRAYIYRRSGAAWELEATLQPSDPGSAVFFGWSVDIEGNRAAIGADWSNGSLEAEGAAYIFERRGGEWVQETQLRSPTPRRLGLFGTSLALSESRVVIGATRELAGEMEGAVHIFARHGRRWTHEARLAEEGGRFYGFSVDMRGPTLVVGSGLEGRAGAAHIYERRGAEWRRTQRLTPNGAEEAEFGISVAISGSRVFVGATREDGVDEDAGAVYIYERAAQQWREDQIIVADDGADSDNFGRSLAVQGGRLLVGAMWRGRRNDGAAYLFDLTPSGWEQRSRIEPDPHDARTFGTSVAMVGDWMAIGANATDPFGAVYVGRSSNVRDGDVNGDGAVDVFDLLAFQPLYLNRDPDADLDRDGSVGRSDLLFLLEVMER